MNVIGDNNGANANQVDEFMFFGGDVDGSISGGDADGANEFYLLINGSSPIGFRSVGFLNITGAGGDDQITIDPWADNTTGGWGIAVTVDGGSTGETNGDHLFYGNIERDTATQPGISLVDNTPDGSRDGVSEAVVLAPTTTTGAGQLRVTNATDSSNIATIDFTTLEDFSFFFNDAVSGENDTLTIAGTSGNDEVTAKFTNAGFTYNNPSADVSSITPHANELIDIDSPAGTQLVQVHAALESNVQQHGW